VAFLAAVGREQAQSATAADAAAAANAATAVPSDSSHGRKSAAALSREGNNQCRMGKIAVATPVEVANTVAACPALSRGPTSDNLTSRTQLLLLLLLPGSETLPFFPYLIATTEVWEVSLPGESIPNTQARDWQEEGDEANQWW
jgi:hypothetical protein